MWNVTAVAVDDACLITSELVTNAVRATGTLEANPSPETLVSLPEVELKLAVARHRLLIGVVDASSEPPLVQQRCESSVGGRGLILVADLAERWSYYPVGGGKVVWAELELPDGRACATTSRHRASAR